jgi:glycosyltransferase involved in cell wall biosynthesis
MIIVASHANIVNGKIHEVPVNTIIEILQNRKEEFIFIRHSMNGDFQSTAYFYKNGQVIANKKIPVILKISILRYITEILFTFSFVYLKRYDSDLCFIGIDPLNALVGCFLKKTKKVKKAIFYTVDFSPKRFANRFLNYCYHTIDKYCVKHSDQVWSVSSRIYEVRKKMGLSNEKNIFLPNVPSSEYEKFVSNNRSPWTLITLGTLSDQIDYVGLFEAVKLLKDEVPSVRLKVIGGGPKEAEYKDYVTSNGLKDYIKFFGQLDHERALEEISTSGIGVALYNGKWNFNYYGDSMKSRE